MAKDELTNEFISRAKAEADSKQALKSMIEQEIAAVEGNDDKAVYCNNLKIMQSGINGDDSYKQISDKQSSRVLYNWASELFGQLP
jgi:hypothetical protein